MDHLVDAELVRQFEWDPQRAFKYTQGKRTRIYTEPWTGTRFWDVQVRFTHSLDFKLMLTYFEDIIT